MAGKYGMTGGTISPPKKLSGGAALGLFSVILTIPTIIYLLMAKNKEKAKEASY